jgi:GNAT superfamily N-acetyltransferase
MLTTSREQAAAYSPGGVVLEYRIPTERIYGSDDYQRGGEPLLWPGQPHDVYGHAATAYAVNGPLPSEYLVGVHSGRTASGSTYYHGSPVLLEPGTVLRPAEESRFARQAEGRVFFTPDPWVAATHAKSPGRNDGATRVYDGRSWLYEVEPVGVVVDDPEAVAAGKAGQSLMAPSAKVVRRLEPEQAVALMMGRTATGDPVFGAVHAAKVLYHGTDASLVDQIRREGLTSPSYAETHNTLTESAHQARTLATKRHLNPVVLRFKVSPEQMDTHLWPAYEYWGHDDTANTYALRQPLPPEAFDGIEQGRTAASGSLPAGYVMEVHEGTRYGQPTVTVLVKHQDDPDTPVAALGLMRRANPLPKSEDPEVFEVNAVQVYPEHQRKGIATAMYDEVHKRYPGVPVLHSFGPGQSTDARALNKTLKQRYGPKMHLGRAQTSLTSTLAENLTERH